MSVEFLDTSRFCGYRVRRQIGGKSYQEYFSLKENGKRLTGAAKAKVKEQAEARELVLARQQAKVKAERAKQRMFNQDGRVRGILYRVKVERSGAKTPVFQVGIKSDKLGKVVNTTVSLNSHNLKDAWHKAIDFYAEHKKVSKRSALYKKLLQAQPTKAGLEAMRSKPRGQQRQQRKTR